MLRFDQQFRPARCPHCSIAHPNMERVWTSGLEGTGRLDGGERVPWESYCCNNCGGVVSAQFAACWPDHPGSPDVVRIGGQYIRMGYAVAFFPEIREAHADIPERARRYLQQAYETKHAPDAAAMVAGSAVDAMLKALGYEKGSLYERIDQARADARLTQGMADWAHEVRLGSNRPRHADAENPHVSAEEAAQSVDFAEALGNFLFVLTARIERGIAGAKEASGGAGGGA
jgi:hypothetical protein